ncbi:MAG: efflux RND transporter permease subunit [Acidobacteria bacterium]|nr:efflux RND transporter permease subunit [Acidobacteriota bacterium]MDW7984776.1 efflux RND transporter permease subunit [Acidobacteriota bacterium]
MKLAELSIRRPVTVSMATAAIFIFGLVAFQRLPLSLLPDITYPSLTIETRYPQAASGEVENLVTRPIEEAVAIVSGVQRIFSRSRPGVSEVVLEFGWGTPMDLAALDVREKLDLVPLPRDAEKPNILRFDPSNDPILRVILSGPPSQVELRRIAEKSIRTELESIEGVAAVKIHGGLQEEIHVLLDETRLAAVGLTIQDVIRSLDRNNVNIAGGSLYEREARYLVRTLSEFRQLGDLAGVVLREDGGRKVLLGDVAEVRRTTREREAIVRINGQEGVELSIFKEGDANTVQVARVVKERLDQIREQMRLQDRFAGIRIDILFDQSRFIEASIREVTNNAVYGGLIAVLVLYLFLSQFRPTFIVGFSIPFSVVATFFVMYLLDIKLNIMSLGGLALGVGMLVDNAIVVLESIVRHGRGGSAPAEAAVGGTQEVGTAVIASTLTTIAVFLPISFIEGVAGQLFKDLALTVTVALLVSMVGSFALIPMLYAYGASRREGPTRFETTGFKRVVLYTFPASILATVRRIGQLMGRGVALALRPLARGIEDVLRVYDRLYPVVLRQAVAHRAWTLLGVTLLAFLALGMTRFMGVEFMPSLSQGEFAFQIELPDGTPLNRTEAVLRDIEAKVRRLPAVQTCMVLIGRNANVGWISTESHENAAVLNVQVQAQRGQNLRHLETLVIEEIRKILESYPDLTYKLQRPSLFSFRTPVEVEVYGEDVEAARAVARHLETALRRIPGLTDVQSSWQEGSPEVRVTFLRDQLARYGLNIIEVAQTLRNKVRGETATEFREGDDKIDIRVWARPDDRDSVQDLANLTVARVQGVPIPLKAVAHIEMGRGPDEIRRVDQKRAIVISANLQGIRLGSASRLIQQAIEQVPMPPGVSAVLSGQHEEFRRSSRSLLLVAGLAIFLVYFVMAAQFESLLQPLILMVTVPLGAIGVILMLGLTGQSLNVIVLMGFIVLAGIVVNNGIVLVSYINALRRRGLPWMEALIEGGRVRVRPILMTTLTTILGLLPMALSAGEGSEIRAPLALTLIGGLTLSTVLTLVVIPVLYSFTVRDPSAAAPEP